MQSINHIIPHKANWLGSRKRIIKQLVVSLFSYITLPFAKHIDNGIEKYFNYVYYIKPDDLIFDGSNESYFSILNQLLEKNSLSNHYIIDIGCGRATLLCWINNNGYSYKEYFGVDIAYKDTDLGNGNKIIHCDIVKCLDIIPPQSIGILCNTLCYLSPDKIEQILANSNISSFIIIDPMPGLFWDAHFSNIKLFYRSISDIEFIMKKYNLHCQRKVVDYGLQFKSHYFFPLIYALHFTRR